MCILSPKCAQVPYTLLQRALCCVGRASQRISAQSGTWPRSFLRTNPLWVLHQLLAPSCKLPHASACSHSSMYLRVLVQVLQSAVQAEPEMNLLITCCLPCPVVLPRPRCLSPWGWGHKSGVLHLKPPPTRHPTLSQQGWQAQSRVTCVLATSPLCHRKAGNTSEPLVLSSPLERAIVPTRVVCAEPSRTVQRPLPCLSPARGHPRTQPILSPHPHPPHPLYFLPLGGPAGTPRRHNPLMRSLSLALCQGFCRNP